MNKSDIFITTTLPYCNGKIHVGAAFEFVLADSLKRYFLSQGHSAKLNIGLDQTGSKILSKSKELGIEVNDYIKSITYEWIESTKFLNIDYDSFYETYTDEHAEQVKKYWNFFLEKGDIYEKEYNGKYCIGCESFKLDKDLLDGKCKDHPTNEIDNVNETNFFFNLSKYKNVIIEWLKTDPISESNKKELNTFLNEYKELSISRKKTEKTFDIAVPNRDDQVIYVWFSALLNYIIIAEDWDNSINIQLCGPDNLRFQSQIFQSFLSALGKKNTNKILVHGTILDKDGQKISKSLGNTIDPLEQLNKFGLTSIRYYLIGGLSTYGNSNWNEEDLIKLYNSDICNDWGNLIARVLHLIDTKSNGVINTPDDDFIELINDYKLKINNSWSDYRFKDVCFTINELVKVGNKYINDEKPWSTDNYVQVLSNLYYLIGNVNKFYYPIIPNTYEDVKTAILSKKKQILFDKI